MSVVSMKQLLEAGVHLYYGQSLVDTAVENGEISYLWISTKKGLKKLKGKIYIDCTGDGDLAAFCGAEYEAGNGSGVFQPGTLRYYPAVESEDAICNYGDNRNHVTLDVTDSDRITELTCILLARALENFGQRISEILEKNETKTLEKADLPFLNSGISPKKGKKVFYFGACLFILIVLVLVALAFFGRSETSVDETGALLMQKTRDSQMQAAPDSVEMPNLEGVLERLKPEEGE